MWYWALIDSFFQDHKALRNILLNLDVLRNKPTSMNNKMAVDDSCNVLDIDFQNK